MMRRFNALLKPTVSYGCEIWGTLSFGAPLSELEMDEGLAVGISPPASKALCKHMCTGSEECPEECFGLCYFCKQTSHPHASGGLWWSQVLGFMHRLAKMPKASLLANIFEDSIEDAEHNLLVQNRARRVWKQLASLDVACPFSGGALRSVIFLQAMLSQESSVWQGLHMPPRQ